MENQFKKTVSARIWGDEHGMYLSYDNRHYLIIADENDYHYAKLVDNKIIKTDLVAGIDSPDADDQIAKNIFKNKSYIDYRKNRSVKIINPALLKKSIHADDITVKLIFVEFMDIQNHNYLKSDYLNLFGICAI